MAEGWFGEKAKRFMKVATLGAGLSSAEMNAEAAPPMTGPETHEVHVEATPTSWADEVTGNLEDQLSQATTAESADTFGQLAMKHFTKGFYFPDQPVSYSAADGAKIDAAAQKLQSLLSQADAKWGTHLVTGDEGAKNASQIADIEAKAKRYEDPAYQEMKKALE